ncbi:MAG: Pvc16 family protein [Chloroflexi bacterium]|nr:Pvc16 family protein [Chloroflexota bacterium]MCI0580775.1 Pvc16 family protein [Chloroflexota bacterium]MCI0648702.1 Pvc16 family protein [Chloroflexota bacterium]MCI0729639.1 Pvc16 family protein [Chloroflexota bacterium]
MIEQVDKDLKSWVQAILNEIDLSLAPPGPAQPGRGVNLYLLELASAPPLRGGHSRPPLQFSLRYLVTAWAEEAEEAHQALGRLIFAAMENPKFEVELEPVPVETWLALGVKPQPSFILRVPLRLERPEPEVPLVRTPPVVQGVPVTTLHGVLLAPGDIPLAGASVELLSLQLTTRTDSKGRFHFVAVPAEPVTKQLRVKAKGELFDVEVKLPAPEDKPAVVYCDILKKKEA